MSERPHEHTMPEKTVLRTITEIGRFNPHPFYPHHRAKTSQASTQDQIAFNAEGMKTLQMKNAKLQRHVNNIDQDIGFLQNAIDRHKGYMKQMVDDHQEQVSLINQQISNRKAQIAKIDNSQEPPTMNQIFALVRQIQVEGMAAKRRAENCLRDQDVNLILSGERLRKFHDFLGPRVADTILQGNPKLRKAFDRMEADIYRVAEIQTQLRSLKIYSSNLERRLIDLNSRYEALQFEKADIQMGIVDKMEELHAELTKRCEELGKLRWKIEYMKSLKQTMDAPRFDVRK